MLRLERVSKIYPNGEVLKDITWEIKPGDRIGLVGVNGAGKSTQLKIIAGLEEVTSGRIFKQGAPRIAYLQQEFDVDPLRTVREELFQAFHEAAKVINKMKLVENDMNSQKAQEDSNYLNNLVEDLGSLQSKFEFLNGYELEARIEKLLPSIGFQSNQAYQLVGEYSGGWQMRIALGKILLQDPDILLLDEPTNHLDLETIKWLENYLLEQSSAMILISHDRAFLDRICTQIVYTDRGIARTYKGNYSSFVEQQKVEREVKQSAYQRQQKDLLSQQKYIDRFRASATRSTQAKSREKLLEKVEKIDSPDSDLRSIQFSFPVPPRSGKEVLSINDLCHGYGDNILFLGANLELERGDKIAFLGPNGSGKSSLLRLILGLERPADGIVKLGTHNVIPAYFAQNQAEALDLNKIVIDTIFDIVPDWTQTKVRSLLGNFCLSNEAVFKLVGQLSGGEKARLALASMLLRPFNLLVLDEPTNHLDIPAKQMLEDAIIDYDGAALIVSHDRYFISRVANKIVEIRDGQLILYKGDYSYYLDKKQQEASQRMAQIALAEKEAKRIANRRRQRKRKSQKKH